MTNCVTCQKVLDQKYLYVECKDCIKYKINNKIEEKYCRTCSRMLSLSEFHKLKSGLYGCHPDCKKCRSNKRKALDHKRPTEGSFLCPDCNQILDISNFHSDRSSESGLQTYCKDCQRNRSNKWRMTFDGFMKCLYKDLCNNAKKRNITMNITIKDLDELYKIQNGRCAITNMVMTYDKSAEPGRNRNIHNISVDRIDSKKHYNKDNIQLVCSYINTIKWDLNKDDFLLGCYYVFKHNKEEIKRIVKKTEK